MVILANAEQSLGVAEVVTLPDGEVGMQLEGKLYAIKKTKPWDEMTKQERDSQIKAGVRFIMGNE